MAGDAVQQIKDRLSIVDVIAPYVELHQAGKHLKGKSPFTHEKTPSFHVSPDRGMYYCFSSSQGGDIFTFVQVMEGVDFKGALKILADKAGVELVPEDPKKRTERDQQYSVLEEATRYFELELAKNKEAMRYLKDRGVTPETTSSWRLGYVPGPPKNGWRHAREHLAKKGFKDNELKRAGLIKEAGEGKEPYDTFRDRIMFPIADPSGRIVAFSGRVLEKDSDAPKYVNSPETELFNKSEILFGYDKAKEGIRKLDFSLIVEGQFDVVLCHQVGYHNAVAVSGTALTSHHVNLLQRLSNRVVLALDADRAGIAAVKRAAELMLSRGIDLKVASVPEGKDPADLAAKSKEALRSVVGKSRHVIEYLLDILASEAKDERTFKLRARDEVVPYLLKIDSHIDREHFIEVMAQRLKTTTDAIHLEVTRLENKKEHQSASNTPPDPQLETPVASTPEARLVSVRHYLLVASELIDKSEASLVRNTFENITKETTNEAKKSVPPAVSSELTFRLEQYFADLPQNQLHEELAERLQELHTIILRRAIRVEIETLQAVERNGDEKRIKDSLATLSELQKQLGETVYTSALFKLDKG